jgi:DNA repair protein RecN (Recombination protein N)
VSLATLRRLAEQLIEIHGQHEHQALLERPAQLALLDAFGGHDVSLATVAQAARRLQAVDRELAAFAPGAGLAPERADWLRFQLQELERDALGPMPTPSSRESTSA